jgi:hypothetical protein
MTVIVDDTSFKAIADAIRAKNGTITGELDASKL